MSAPSYAPYPAFGAPASSIGRLRAQFGPLALIVAAHALLLYGIYSGLLHRVVTIALPQAVFVSFVAAPPPTPAPPSIQLAVAPTLPPPAITLPVTILSIATLPSAIGAPAPAAPAADKPAPATAFVAAAAPLAPPAPAGPRTITSGVEYLQAPQPVYPPLSKRMGEQGKVVLRILVNEKGLPDQVLVQASSGFARLDEAGRQAALRALFKPHLEDGRPVAVFVIVPLNFQLAS